VFTTPLFLELPLTRENIGNIIKDHVMLVMRELVYFLHFA